jgi:hypothetical protein
VDIGTEKPFNPEGACGNQPGTDTEAYGATRTSPVTNAFGEFSFCYHHHGMSRSTPGTGTIRIASLNVEKKVEFDGFMRYSEVVVKLDTANPSANKTVLNEFYTVQGRAWRAENKEIKIENIGVYGDTVHDKPYNVTVEFTGLPAQSFSGTTNHYGDFAFRVPVTARPTGGKVTLVIENETFTGDVDPATGFTFIRAQIGNLHKTPGAPLFAILGLAGLVALLAPRRR